MRPTGAEQLSLAVRAQAGDVEARDALVAANMAFVWGMAHRYARGSVILEPGDLASEGAMGIMHAIEKFDASRGVLFMTYAGPWVRSYIARAATNARTPFGGSEKARRLVGSGLLSRGVEELRGEGCSDEEVTRRLAEEHGLGIGVVAAIRRVASAVSLDASPGDDGVPFVELVLSESEGADERLDLERRKARVREVVEALGALSARERAILSERILSDDPATLDEIGTRFECSRERIRQIEKSLLDRIREVFLREDSVGPSMNSLPRLPSKLPLVSSSKKTGWAPSVSKSALVLLPKPVAVAPLKPVAVPPPKPMPVPFWKLKPISPSEPEPELASAPESVPPPPVSSSRPVLAGKLPVDEVVEEVEEVVEPRVEAVSCSSEDAQPVLVAPVRPVATLFCFLLSSGRTRGFIQLVSPLTFEESVAEQALIRDVEGEGVCARCGASARGWRCEECSEAHRLATNARRSRLRAEGKCVFCGLKECDCGEKNRERVSSLRRRRYRNGLCELCGMPAVKGGVCEEHRPGRLAKASAREAKKRAGRREAGLCTGCGKEMPEEGFSKCRKCLDRVSSRKRAKRDLDGSASVVGERG